jgi:hypothetical protein
MWDISDMERKLSKSYQKNESGIIIFESEENKVVPVFAKIVKGTPYTGFASGSSGSADWSGSYENGLPHGKFTIFWGDKHGGDVFFEHGQSIDKRT